MSHGVGSISSLDCVREPGGDGDRGKWCDVYLVDGATARRLRVSAAKDSSMVAELNIQAFAISYYNCRNPTKFITIVLEIEKKN